MLYGAGRRFSLSMGLGHKNFKDNAEHHQGIQHSVEVCNKLGKLACYNAFSVAEAKERVAQGFRGITMRSDVDWFPLGATGPLLKANSGTILGRKGAGVIRDVEAAFCRHRESNRCSREPGVAG